MQGGKVPRRQHRRQRNHADAPLAARAVGRRPMLSGALLRRVMDRHYLSHVDPQSLVVFAGAPDAEPPRWAHTLRRALASVSAGYAGTVHWLHIGMSGRLGDLAVPASTSR